MGTFLTFSSCCGVMVNSTGVSMIFSVVYTIQNNPQHHTVCIRSRSRARDRERALEPAPTYGNFDDELEALVEVACEQWSGDIDLQNVLNVDEHSVVGLVELLVFEGLQSELERQLGDSLWRTSMLAINQSITHQSINPSNESTEITEINDK